MKKIYLKEEGKDHVFWDDKKFGFVLVIVCRRVILINYMKHGVVVTDIQTRSNDMSLSLMDGQIYLGEL